MNKPPSLTIKVSFFYIFILLYGLAWQILITLILLAAAAGANIINFNFIHFHFFSLLFTAFFNFEKWKKQMKHT